MNFYIRLHLNKICSCCFLDMRLYSINLLTIATISSLVRKELFPACFSCNKNFNQSQSSLGSDDKSIVFEIPEAGTIKPGDFKKIISVRSLVLLLPTRFISKRICFANSYISFLSVKLAWLRL